MCRIQSSKPCRVKKTRGVIVLITSEATGHRMRRYDHKSEALWGPDKGGIYIHLVPIENVLPNTAIGG